MKFSSCITALSLLIITACGGNGSDHHQDRNAATGPEAGAEMAGTSPIAAVPDELAEAFDRLLDDYLRLAEVLVDSDAGNAAAAADMLKQTTEELVSQDADEELRTKLENWKAELTERSGAIAAESNVEDQRSDFEVISGTVITMVEAMGHQKETLYHQRCPMVNGGNGDWLSTAEVILNPYHGERMLNCGSTVREL